MHSIYDTAPVIASYVVATAASYGALDLGRRLAFFEGVRRRLWLIGGAVAMGTGLWSTQFVGMNAFRASMIFSDDLGLTVLSWMAGCAVALLALLALARVLLGYSRIAVGSLMIGLGICVMHYAGLSALRLAPAPVYGLGLLAGSALVAVAAPAAALLIIFDLGGRWKARPIAARLAAAAAMGAAICGQHYTAMAAARIGADAHSAADTLLGSNWTGLPLALIICLMLGFTVWLSIFDLKAIGERERLARIRIRVRVCTEAERVHRLTCHDSATGLPNRALFTEKLRKQLVDVRHTPSVPVGLVYAELRGYRLLIEQYGQERMNRILKTLAQQLSRQLQNGELLARLSHDGLILFARECGERNTEATTSTLRALLSTPLHDAGESFRFSWGIGSSRFPDHGNSAPTLIRAAMKIQSHIGMEAPPPAAATAPRYAMAS